MYFHVIYLGIFSYYMYVLYIVRLVRWVVCSSLKRLEGFGIKNNLIHFSYVLSFYSLFFNKSLVSFSVSFDLFDYFKLWICMCVCLCVYGSTVSLVPLCPYAAFHRIIVVFIIIIINFIYLYMLVWCHFILSLFVCGWFELISWFCSLIIYFILLVVPVFHSYAILSRINLH